MRKGEMFGFLSLLDYYWIKFFITKHIINNHIIKTINVLRFLFGLYSSIFLLASAISLNYSIEVLESLKCFKFVLSPLLIKN